MTSQAGLVLFGEFLHSLDLRREIDRAFGAPGSGAGYPASAYVLPLLLMLNGGVILLPPETIKGPGRKIPFEKSGFPPFTLSVT